MSYDLIGTRSLVVFFFFHTTTTTEIYTLSLHDALPISLTEPSMDSMRTSPPEVRPSKAPFTLRACTLPPEVRRREGPETDRKSTRLNSSHLGISYAVFCLKKKNVTSCRWIHTYSHRDMH